MSTPPPVAPLDPAFSPDLSKVAEGLSLRACVTDCRRETAAAPEPPEGPVKAAAMPARDRGWKVPAYPGPRRHIMWISEPLKLPLKK